MLKKGTLIKNKYYGLVVSMGLVFVISVLTSLVDFILGGILFDEMVVSAIEIVSPIYSISYGIGGLLVAGCLSVIGREKGRFDLEKADKIFSQSIIVSIIGGTIASMILYFAKDAFLLLSGCSAQLYEYASTYYNYYIPLPLILTIGMLLLIICEIDGDSLTNIVSQIVLFVSHIIITLLCYKTMGIGSISFGCIIGFILCFLVLLTHFLKRTNSFKFRFYFNVKDVLEVMKYGLSDGLRYFTVAISDIIVNVFITSRFGDVYLCAYAVYNVITNLLDMTCCIYEAGNSFNSVYFGEQNINGVKYVLSLQLKVSLIVGAISSVLLICLSKQIPLLYGITSVEVYKYVVKGIIYMGSTMIAYCILNIIIGSYNVIEHIKISLLALILYIFIFPIVLPILFSSLMGFDGFGLGIALNPLLSLIICVIVLLVTKGTKGFPLYLKESDEQIYSCDLKVTYEHIDDVCDFVENCLKENNIDMSLVLKIRLMCEELYTKMFEKNENKSIISECYLMIGEKYIRLIVRDNGEIYNYADVDNKIESFNSYCLARIITNNQSNTFTTANSINRNGFVFFRS